jgi:hypothetical protein
MTVIHRRALSYPASRGLGHEMSVQNYLDGHTVHWRAGARDCDDEVVTIPDDRPHIDADAEVTLSLDHGETYPRQDGPPDALHCC